MGAILLCYDVGMQVYCLPLLQTSINLDAYTYTVPSTISIMGSILLERGASMCLLLRKIINVSHQSGSV